MSKYEQSENQLDQALGMNEMLLSALEADRADRKKTRRVSIVCATVCAVSVLLFACILGVLAAGVTIETTTTTDTVAQETTGDGDAVYQAGDGSHYYADGGNG